MLVLCCDCDMLCCPLLCHAVHHRAVLHHQVQAAHRGVVWQRTKSWVEIAAQVAPLTTEALLHSFITSSDSLPGATAPAWLPEERMASARTGEDDLQGTIWDGGGRLFRVAVDAISECLQEIGASGSPKPVCVCDWVAPWVARCAADAVPALPKPLPGCCLGQHGVPTQAKHKWPFAITLACLVTVTCCLCCLHRSCRAADQRQGDPHRHTKSRLPPRSRPAAGVWCSQAAAAGRCSRHGGL